MKRAMILVVFLALTIVSQVFAGTWEGEGFYMYPGGNVGYFTEEPNNMSNLTCIADPGNTGDGGSAGDITNNNSNTLNNTNTLSNSQSQEQNQGQSQGIYNSGNSSVSNSNSSAVTNTVNIKNQRAFMSAPGTTGTEQHLFQGKVIDVTCHIPVPALIGFKPYNDEGFVDVFTVEGWGFGLLQNRIRTGDLLQNLLKARQQAVDKGWNIESTRYKIFAVDAAKSYSTSGAGAASGALNGGTGGGAGTIGIFPGMSYGEAVPRYIIWVLKTEEQAKKVSEGWSPVPEDPSLSMVMSPDK
jgi:hypothetical protein